MPDVTLNDQINAPIKSKKRFRWWMVPLGMAVAWYLSVWLLIPRITKCGPAGEYLLARANLKFISQLNPANIDQARCVVGKLTWETDRGGYEVSVLDQDSGWSFVCIPHQPYVYVDNWLHSLLFLQRPSTSLKELRFDFPERILMTVGSHTGQLSPGEDLSERWKAHETGGCDGPDGVFFPDCCAE